MSRLDDIEKRLAALEAGDGSALVGRVVALEETLGLSASGAPVTATKTANIIYEGKCGKCGMDQRVTPGWGCQNGKCPVLAAVGVA